jgi:hypothetical protein
MTEFDPEKFEDKYVHYFNELQRAYKNAFERMNETYDSELIHAIDQQILNESEPIYEGSAERGSADDSSGARPERSEGLGEANGDEEPVSGQGPREQDGGFRIDLPDDPAERTRGVVVDEEKLEEVLDIYVDELETEIRKEFGFE